MSTQMCLIISRAEFKDRENLAISLISNPQKTLAETFQTKIPPSDQKAPADPDILWLKPAEEASSLGVEQVRELSSWLATKPIHRSEKVAVITNAEALTVEAQNALLKTLEEPPESTSIILLVPDTANLLPTVISRCFLWELPASQVSLKQGLPDLKYSIAALARTSTGEKLKAAAEIAKSRPDALTWLDSQLLLTNYRYLRPLFKAKKYLQANTNVRLTIENLLLNW